MSVTSKFLDQAKKYSARNYHPLPIVLKKGLGSKVWDVDGKEYLDFLSCYSALNFGHQHPKILEALFNQARDLAVCSRAFHSEVYIQFIEELAKFCAMESVLLMNSGTEAVETAIKVARKWGYKKKGIADGKAKIIAMKNNFHGRTISVVSFSTEAAYRDGFGPFTPGFEIVPFGDIAALERAIDADTAAVLMEPIQAEAGILTPPLKYLSEVRRLTEEKNVLLALDEIQTGLGRTGKNFCYEHYGVKPDLLILGKSLGGGILPLSAVLSSWEIMEVIHPGEHGSTFGGNPLASAVGRAALKILKEEKIADKAFQLGEVMLYELAQCDLPKVKEIRGKGALIGVEMEASTGGARKYCERLAEKGVLCKETHDYVIRLAPPLTSEIAEVKKGIHTLVEVIQELG